MSSICPTICLIYSVSNLWPLLECPAPEVRDLSITVTAGSPGLDTAADQCVFVESDCVSDTSCLSTMYVLCYVPVTGRSRRSKDDGRRMSARNLKRSSSLSRSASYMGPTPMSWVPTKGKWGVSLSALSLAPCPVATTPA